MDLHWPRIVLISIAADTSSKHLAFDTALELNIYKCMNLSNILILETKLC